MASSSVFHPTAAFEIGRLDAHGQAERVRRGDLSAIDLVEAAITRIEHLDPKVGAISHRAFELARRRVGEPLGQGALAGVPYLLKDSTRYPGMPAYAGSRSRDGRLGQWTAPFFEAFDAQGLVPVGMSTMAELGLMFSTETIRFGPTRNPWNPALSVGGSSGGAAAAVAAGLTPLAHASDGGGSIRVPAATCGVVGLKPGRGRNLRARAPHLLDDVLCSDSLISRSVRDVAWAYAAAATDSRPAVTKPQGPRLRIGLLLDGMDGAAPQAEISRVVERAARLCADLGHTVDLAPRRPADRTVFDAFFDILLPYMARDAADHALAANPNAEAATILEPWTLGLAAACDRLDPLTLERGFTGLQQAAVAHDAYFQTFDVLLSPVLSSRTATIGDLDPCRPIEALREHCARYSPYTPMHNMAGAPAITLPLYAGPDGSPVGSMFSARRGEEETLLALALELEAAMPWASRWPVIAPPDGVSMRIASDGSDETGSGTTDRQADR